MKPLLEDIGKKRGQDSFLAFEIRQHGLDFFWHYHPEYELTLIVKGKGQRLVGDSHSYFESGDLVLIGPGLPHTWVGDENWKEAYEIVVIQFSSEFIERFAGLTELKAIHQLLLNAKQGIDLNEKGMPDKARAINIRAQIQQIPTKKGIDKIIALLHILNELSNAKSIRLASSLYQPLKGSENEKRINKVCQFIQKHAAERLTIQNAAALIHLSPTAFCKFFKRMTGKTFSDYVNDIRIANVCNQLLATDKQVAEIAYENGFETLTYFNRIFLKKKGMRPSDYRKVL
jgi:AraC-like DNA-binding protein